ncbi:MAG: hypothetical protein MRJ92_06615 [Nitrospira sp.]|nr:hypothetical protein [Nitrospira sp.]
MSRPLTTYCPTDERGTVPGQLAQAHQGVVVGSTRSRWATLQLMWSQQASPGLYTWDTVRSMVDEVADGWQYARVA